MEVLKSLKLELQYDPAIHSYVYNQKEKKTLIRTYTLMFIATVFTIIKIWKQLKCLSRDEWTKKIWYIYIYNGILPILQRMKNLIHSSKE